MASSIARLTTVVLAALKNTLPQSESNGDSRLGTLSAPTLPMFLTENTPLPNGFPWGPLTAEGSDPYTQAPLTGVTRRYNFNVGRARLAPDGVEKDMIVINNQFPGPTIEANWGDWIEVKVTNNLEDEGTSLHWHGLLQKATPWFDGVPSVQQCPIAPGSTFTYRFRADLYGTSWWHSHYSAQYAGGMLGPMIIHGPNHLRGSQKYDIDLGPIFITDWYHREYFDLIKDVINTDVTKVLAAGRSSNNLINGKMAFNCSLTTAPCKDGAGVSKFNFRAGKKHRLRLINGGAEGQQLFTIDEHEFTVIAHDFVPVKPYKAKWVSLGIGQRLDVVVEATGDPKKSYFMRSTIFNDCTPSSQPSALAIVYYPQADTSKLPTSTPANATDLPSCADSNFPLASTVPVYPIKPPAVPEITHNIEIKFEQNATDFWVWKMNEVSFRANFNNPILLLANKGNTSYPENWNVYDSKMAKSIRIVLYNNSPARHPMHLHGHNMFELSSGPGEWDGTSITNPNNPARRDTHIIEAMGHLVLQYNADNPGVWPFHCHIAWHVSGGLYVNLMERTDDIKKRMQIPQIMHQTCRDWATFTNTTVVAQIDSGL
ncbi:Cupredoxin [Geopyxis carbonaria]|nr:Cupredoxin [Geopyxis carbonaria]